MARCRWADGWAWFDFEADFRAWMQQAYPDVAAEIFPGSQISRDGRSAEIAMDYIDEFLDESDRYPRAADAVDAMVELIAIALFTE